MKKVLKEYEKQLFKVVIAKEIAPGCYQQEVISDTVLDNIEKSDDNRKAQELLFHHLDDCGTVHALKILCDEINLDAYSSYPIMQSLVEEMKDMLEREG